jgi:hypothetical protein
LPNQVQDALFGLKDKPEFQGSPSDARIETEDNYYKNQDGFAHDEYRKLSFAEKVKFNQDKAEAERVAKVEVEQAANREATRISQLAKRDVAIARQERDAITERELSEAQDVAKMARSRPTAPTRITTN